MLVRVLAFALILPLASGCFLKPKKKSGKKSSGASGLIQRDSIFMDRIGDGDSARLTFKTGSAAQCEMAFYSQEANGTPTKEAPTVVPCAKAEAHNEFVEELPGLKTDTLYYVLLTAWYGDASKEDGETITIKETPNNSSIITPGGEGSDGLFRDLLVARLDVPLGVAEIHRHSLPEPADVASIKTKLTRTLGCQQGVPQKDAPFREAAADVVIQKLVTRDFAAGSAAAHPEYPGRLQLSYPSMNEGVAKWSLLYQLNGKDIQVPIRPVRTIVNMEMESAEIINFEKPQLAEAVDPLKIDPTKPLKFSWTTENQPQETAYMTIQIGRPEYEKAIYCVFPADKLSGEIEPKLLQNLDDGKQVVLAEMASNQLWVKDGWLVTVYDWRSGRIEK